MIRHIEMLKVNSNQLFKVIFFVLMLISFPLQSWSANEERGEWSFYKVSSVNVFGNVDKDINTHLEKIYNRVRIITNDGVLTVNNDILASGEVCSIKYVTMKRSALSYYHSNKIVGMYRELFFIDGVNFSRNLEILTSLNPDDACSMPFSEIIKVEDLLFFSDKDFVIYLKKKESGKNKVNEFDAKNDISDFCRNTEKQKEFDGTDEITCFFERVTLHEAYSRLLLINEYAYKYFRSKLPDSDLTYKKDDILVNYNWVGNKSINIKLSNGGEVFAYSFYLIDNGTQLRIKGITDY